MIIESLLFAMLSQTMFYVWQITKVLLHLETLTRTKVSMDMYTSSLMTLHFTPNTHYIIKNQIVLVIHFNEKDAFKMFVDVSYITNRLIINKFLVISDLINNNMYRHYSVPNNKRHLYKLVQNYYYYYCMLLYWSIIIIYI